MRIRLIAIGSTGDVQPMIVLGKRLKARGHWVSFAAFEALQSLVEEAGLDFHPIPGDAERYIGNVIRPGANPITFLSRFERALVEVADPLFESVWAACHGVDAIVSTFFGSTLYAMAEKLGVPLFQSNYCLTDKNSEYCLPLLPKVDLGAWANRATYSTAYFLISLLERRYSVPWCREHGILSRHMAQGPNYRVGSWRVPVLYAMSELVVPRPEEWPRNIHITGFWEDAYDPRYTPPAALLDFMQAGDAPIYVGFGSMTSGDMGEALQLLLGALSRTGLRAVLSTGWGGMDASSLPGTVYVLRHFTPHQWLFANVRAVVHHGGAGTTAAGLAAGRPTLVIPFGGDQYFWGARVHALGCGPKPLPRTQMDVGSLTDALNALTATPAYRDTARQLGDALSREDGAARAADIIEAALRAHYRL